MKFLRKIILLLMLALSMSAFSNNEFFASLLSKKLGKKALAMPDGRYAGAYGAALLARERSEKA